MAFTRIGYGQVEPNQLSGIKTGQIYASLPLDTQVAVLQNGEFMYYNYSKNKVTSDSTGAPSEPYLVYQEIKIYEDWLSYKDFAMIKVGENYVTNPAAVGRVTSQNADGTIYADGSMTTSAVPPMVPAYGSTAAKDYGYRLDHFAPRLVKTNVGDVYTTNMVKTGNDITYAVGNVLTPKANETTKTLQLEVGTGAIEFTVVKVYTMPDGQQGLKLQRTK